MRDEIENNLEGIFHVFEKDLLKNRYKISGKNIVEKNNHDKNKTDIKVIRKMNISNHKFNILVEENNYVFGCLEGKKKVNVDCSRLKSGNKTQVPIKKISR